jgi:Protein of unknown function (DUF1254)
VKACSLPCTLRWISSSFVNTRKHTRKARTPASTQSEHVLSFLPVVSRDTANMHLHLMRVVLAGLLFDLAAALLIEQSALSSPLVYGYPLLIFEQLAPLVLTLVGINNLFHARMLDTSSNRTVVKLNVDTLYSTMIFDLSQHNVAFTIPDILSNQFNLFSYYDT